MRTGKQVSSVQDLPAGQTAGGDSTGGSGLVLVAMGTAFFASLCVMGMEIAAGRIIARWYGASLYTWTSVIGVILAGLTLGNYLGGRLADAAPGRQPLSSLLILSSVATVAALELETRAKEWFWLWSMGGSGQILVHMMILFLPPSVVLGMVSPVAARMALASPRGPGRILGSLSAWNTIGSIVGTFLSGFYLVARVGPNGVLWGASVGLAAAGIAVARHRRVPLVWGGMTALLVVVGVGPWEWARRTGEILSLRPVPSGYMVFEADSQYSSVRVLEPADQPGLRYLYLDKLLHSQTILSEPDNLLYEYEHIYAILTHRFACGKDRITTLSIGGGGYVFPSYLNRHWPGSHTEVVEIDPMVTKAAQRGFGLPENSPIEIHHLDARNHVETLVRRKQAGEPVPSYDFIYGDAFNDFAPPYHLTTEEFVGDIRSLLSPDGMYLLNLIDDSSPGRFLAAVFETTRRVFPRAYVFTTAADVARDQSGKRFTWVVVGSMRELDLADLRLPADAGGPELVCWRTDPAYLDRLCAQNRHIALSDDYAPVEQLLAHLRKTQESWNSIRYYMQATRLAEEGDVQGAIEQYQRALRINPDHVDSLNNLGVLLMNENRAAEAVPLYLRAVTTAPRDCKILVNYGLSLALTGRLDEAIEQYRAVLRFRPNDVHALYNLGLAHKEKKEYAATLANWREAMRYNPENPLIVTQLAKLLAVCPDVSVRDPAEGVTLASRAASLTNRKDLDVLFVLSVTLAQAGQFDDAVAVTKEAIALAESYRQDGVLPQLREHLELYRQHKPARLP